VGSTTQVSSLPRRQKKTALSPIPVAALGMEKRTYRSLDMYFQSVEQKNYILVDEENAAISIIDMDGFKAKGLLHQHKTNFPGRPVILIALNEIPSTEDIYIQKPIKVSTLIAALHTAQKRVRSPGPNNPPTEQSPEPQIMQFHANVVTHESDMIVPPVLHKPVSTAATRDLILRPKVKYAEFEHNKWSSRSLDSLVLASESGLHLLPEEYKKNDITTRLLRELQYNPDNMLQGYFKKAYDTAITSRCTVKLEGPWRPITIRIKKHQVYVESNFRHIFALSAMQFNEKDVSISLLRKDEDDKIYTDGLTQSIEQFFWKLSLRTSRGKVPFGTELDVPILLNQWPNFTRTTVTPHALRIAALWTKQPTSLLKTAEILDISLSFVFAFYSSALPLNLLSHLKDDFKIGDEKESMKKHTYRKLFRSLLNTFNKNKNSVDIS